MGSSGHWGAIEVFVFWGGALMLDVPCRALLLGLGCNPKLSDVSLDLSCCEVTPV